MNQHTPSRRIARTAFRIGVLLATLGAVAFAALIGSLWVEHRSEITLPAPTGPFAVGRSTYAWVDDAHADPVAPVAGTRRELLVRVWYPSAPGQPGATVDDYLPVAERAIPPASSAPAKPPALIVRVLTSVMGLLSRDISKVHGHSLRDSDVSPREPSYPVVLMRAGASAEVTNYSTLAEDLASHGYVVVGLDAPYRTGRVVFPDGRVVERAPENNPELYAGDEFVRLGNKLLAAWTADMTFALDRLSRLNTLDSSGKFTGRLDMTRVGVFGHSFGGAQAAQFCSEDSRCKAAIDVDGAPLGTVVQTGMPKPFMFLLSDHGTDTDSASRQIKADIQSMYDRLPADTRLRVAIRGANHFTFSDDGALLKSRLVRGALRLFGKLSIDGGRQLAVTRYCIHSFFDVYLRGPGVSRLVISSPLYPEIQTLE